VTVTDDGSDGSARDQRTLRSRIFGSRRRPFGRRRKRALAVNRIAWWWFLLLYLGLRTFSLAFLPRAFATLTRFRSAK
jgi:hypothetical protein